MEKKNNSGDNPYKDHRKRMRERVAMGAFDSFPDHEALEFLLFYIFRQKDTKPTAKLLVEQFGSLSGVLDAGIDEITEVPGMGRDSAIALVAFRKIMKRYITQKRDGLTRIDSLSGLLGFVRSKLEPGGMLAIFLDAQGNIIHSGHIYNARFKAVDILNMAAEYSAISVIIAQYRKDNTEPEREDIALNDEISERLSELGQVLSEHIILSGNKYFSFAQKGML